MLEKELQLAEIDIKSRDLSMRLALKILQEEAQPKNANGSRDGKSKEWVPFLGPKK